MELEQDSNLTLPLFILDETLSTRDLAQPDVKISVILSDELLTQLCQNPSADSSIGISITDYELNVINSSFSSVVQSEHDAQLTLTQGPLLSAVVTTVDELTFVSPQVDMMPTFDLGDEAE
ncbi:hypothetical protein FHG08_04985 [Pseudoalteromonas sp. Scap03]|uniref:hypothetical protein n=1 Tax=unclassified Pseudoalteromonas TaxID=194690 RepID=UPI0015BA4DF4|nr:MULTISPECIES: hypothetical protein [unclassified Pseudoalteromonas]NWL15118.1 hypothetical protein [Pseudoalteromonas sp. Scap03]QLE80245.1 hypothetical protein FLM54_01250 [Pseudoalteromonas sp. Scap25]QLE88187.1 hypothetical protein FLM47_01250 [Pseudoalteromonas sp. Scap06]